MDNDKPVMIPIPEWIEVELKKVSGRDTNVVGACFTIQNHLETMERNVTAFAEKQLNGIANNLRSHVDLKPFVFQYVIEHIYRNMDDFSLPETLIVLVQDDDKRLFERERTFEGYDVKLLGTPAYIIDNNQRKISIQPDRREVITVSTDPGSVSIYETITPISPTVIKQTRYRIKQFGAQIITTDWLSDRFSADLVQGFGNGIVKGILDGTCVEIEG